MDLWTLFVLLPLDSAGALYTVLVGFIIISCFGVPIPEELTLLLAGYLAYLGFLDYWTSVLVMIMGVVIGDCIGYALGRYAGNMLYRTSISRFAFTHDMVDKGKRAFDRFGERVVFISRPISGLRFVVPILAGHFRMNVKKFLIYDVAAAIPWTIFVVTLSYYLGSIFALMGSFSTVAHTIFWAVVIVCMVLMIRRVIRKKKITDEWIKNLRP